ncbi:MAG TPA: BNR-4 repeat-containing protein [Bacilli bacterium]
MIKGKIKLLFILSVLCIMLLPNLGSASANLTLVPYSIDSSNQAAWWSPLETYGTTSEYAYMAFNEPGSTAGTHKVAIARRDNLGSWIKLPVMDGSSQAEYIDDLGHNQPSIARDGDGYFHVFASMHGDSWRYFRSDTVDGNPQNHSSDMPDSTLKFTYPNVTVAPNGDVYLIIRAGESDRQSGRLYRWDNAANIWSRVAIFASEADRSVYPDDVQVDANGGVHILFEWSAYPSSALRHELSYLKYVPSTGQFYNAAGNVVSVPVTTSTADKIQPLEGTEQYQYDPNNADPGGPGSQSAKLTFDSSNSPKVAYRYRSPSSGSNFEVRYASVNSGAWSRETVYSTSQTKAAIDITWTGTQARVYYVLATGTDRAFAATKGTSWVSCSLAPGKPIERLSVERNANGIDILYLVDITNLSLYYGRYDGTCTPPPSCSLPTPPLGYLLFDDFEDGDACGWTAVNGTWGVVTDVSKLYKQTATGGEGLTYAGIGTWTDYTAQADLKLYDNVTNAASGILARYTDSNNYYMLRLHNSGKVQLYKKVAGTFTLLTEATQTVSSGSTYTLKLVLSGSTLTGYVNGTQKVSASDSSLASGKIGVRTYKQTVGVDNVSVN